MEVRVRTVGPLREVLGAPEVTVNVPAGATVGDLLDRLAAEKGETFALYARKAKDASVYTALRMVVNGRDVRPGQCGEAVLYDGDDVLMFTPIAGG